MMYHTIVIDKAKFNRWLKLRQSNGSRINASVVAHQIGYGKSYMSQLLSGKYDIEISARFIGSFLARYGMDFQELFKIVPANADEDRIKPSDYYLSASNNRRMTEESGPNLQWAS